MAAADAALAGIQVCLLFMTQCSLAFHPPNTRPRARAREEVFWLFCSKLPGNADIETLVLFLLLKC